MGNIARKERCLKEVNVNILGLDRSGKSTLFRSMFPDTKVKDENGPTIGFNEAEYKHENIVYKFLDLGGMSRLRSLWRFYCNESTNAIIFVVDGSDHERIPEAILELENLKYSRRMKDFNLLVFVNKTDKSNSVKAYEIKKLLKRLKINFGRKAKFVDASFTNGKGVLVGIEWLVKRVGVY